MIFKQVHEIIYGTKTQTRRVCKPTEYPAWGNAIVGGEITAVYASNRLKWRTLRTYAVVAKRGKPSVHTRLMMNNEYEWCTGRPNPEGGARWEALRVRITSIKRQCLQEITEDDARAEGVASVAEYRALWESINGKTKGARWDDNPLVWVLTFEVVR